MSLTYGFALRPTDNSADFANAIYNIVGDGVTQYGGQFALTVNGFSVTAASGYAFTAGRWIKNDEPLVLNIQPSGNSKDRTDAVVACVDYINRTVNLKVLTGIDTATRDDTEYCIVLYLIKVRRGATSITPSDITDVRTNKELCGTVIPFSAIAGDVLRVYRFLTSGIDKEVARVIALSEAMILKADKDIDRLNEKIKTVDGTAQIGELLLTCVTPTPKVEWLLCDGGIVPAEYQALSEMLGGALPNIPGDRYRTYIYGGKPAEV